MRLNLKVIVERKDIYYLSIAANSAHVGFTKKADAEPGVISVDLDAITGMHGIQFDLLLQSIVMHIIKHSNIIKCFIN